MTDEVKPTQADAENQPEATVNPEDTPAETPEETPKEKTPETLGETLKEAPLPEKPTVGLDKFLEMKKDNKELKKEIQDLRKSIEQGATKKEVRRDIAALAEEHNVDPEFLSELASAIRAEAEQSIEDRLRPLTERDQNQQREAKFKQLLDATLEEMPEFKGVINENILKQLAYNPANKDKTFAQLVEETYGGYVGKDRKTIETTRPHVDSSSVDYERAKTDMDYYKEVMSDPIAKKKYNEKMLNDVARFL